MKAAFAILYRFPIQVIVPLLLVGFFSIMLVSRLSQRMVRLQYTLGYLHRDGDMSRVQAEISALGTDPYLIHALLTDAQGTIIAAH